MEVGRFVKAFGGQEGFDIVRQHVKIGNEYCKNLSLVIKERQEMEMKYAIKLTKLHQDITAKTTAATEDFKDSTVMHAWLAVAKLTESEASIHKQLSAALEENVIKPLENLNDNFSKYRKPVEAEVDKLHKVWLDRRECETRAKKKAFNCCRDAEKFHAQMEEQRNCGNKDDGKMMKKYKSMMEQSYKADKEYFDCCLKTEDARLKWQYATLKGLAQLECIELDRLNQLNAIVKNYQMHMKTLIPALSLALSKLEESVICVNPGDDIQSYIKSNSVAETVPEQVLFELPATDMTIPMARQTRERYLLDYKAVVEARIQKEKHVKEGCEKMLKAFYTGAKMGNKASEEEARQNMSQIMATLNYLNATQFRIQSTLNALQNGAEGTLRKHKLESFMRYDRDANKLPVTILRVPLGYSQLSNKMNAAPPPPTSPSYASNNRAPRSTWCSSSTLTSTLASGMPTADYVMENSRTASFRSASRSTQPLPPVPADDIYTVYYSSDEFESDEDDTPPEKITSQQPLTASQLPRDSGVCRALHAFQGRSFDELTFVPGDIITIQDKSDSQWWRGELNGKSGVFPANYVAEH